MSKIDAVRHGPWRKVRFAESMSECEHCGEPYCHYHGKHFCDCACIGPMEDGVEYEYRDGEMYGRREITVKDGASRFASSANGRCSDAVV